jgi:hypothetical protein
MMKKLLLMSAITALGAGGAMAQTASRSIVSPATTPSLQSAGFSAISSSVDPGIKPTGRPSAKGTASGSRWYSYVEFLSKKDATITSDSVEIPYTWGKGDAKGIYSTAGGGLIADTIRVTTLGITFDPAFSTTSGFNEPTAYDKSLIAITRADAYTVDSVAVFSSYGRNIFKTTSVDTLRIAIVYGNGTSASDLGTTTYTAAPGAIRADFGVDTLKVLQLKYDDAKMSAAGTTRIIKDILLRSTDTSSFIKSWGVPVGMNVPAGNVVGVSSTFISGETYTPYVDTAFYGSARPANPFGMGMMRPRVFADATNTFNKSFPAYDEGYYNRGFIKFKPQGFDPAFYADKYVSTLVYVAAFNYELPDIDVKISCTACKTIEELAGGSAIKESNIVSVNAFPNPANSALNVPFTIAEKANVTVSISNMVGQVIATQNMGSINAGQKATATFNTSNLANGVYMYTVEANGQRVSNRFSVAH